VSSPTFLFPGAASHLSDVTTPLRRVTLFSYEAKMSSLTPLHFSVILRHVASPFKLKLKYRIYTTVNGHPLPIARLASSTVLKALFQSWSLSLQLNHVFILSSP
jgi:hypothetical protein